MSLPRAAWIEARETLQKLLSKDCPVLRDDRLLRETAFVKQSNAIMHLPCEIGDYTDFFSSIHHVNNACKIFNTPMAQNWYIDFL
jgi:fumarylacetoacetase